MKKFILIILTITITNAYAFENEKYVTVKSGVKMRERPDINSEIIFKIPYKEKVEIIEENKDIITIENISSRWTKVKYKNNIGWIFGEFLEDVSSTGTINITSSGIGPLKMGESFDKFVTFLKPDKTIINEDGTWDLYKNNLLMMRICDKNWGNDKIVVWAAIYSNKFRFPGNIRVGDTIDNFLKKYPCKEINISVEGNHEYFEMQKFFHLNESFNAVSAFVQSNDPNKPIITDEINNILNLKTDKFHTNGIIVSFYIHQ